jgi:hypothetical protein
MNVADCINSHSQLFVLMTPFGNGDWKVTSTFLVQVQLALVAGSSSTVASSIREVRMSLIIGVILLSATPHIQVYVWG